MSGDDLFQTASRLHQSGDPARAEPLYRQFLQQQPNHADAWHLLGFALHQTGQSDEAIDCLRKATGLQPGNAAFHNNLGEMVRQRDRPAEAVTCFQQALTLQPSFPEAHYNLGNALKALDRPAEAIAAYRRAVQLRPQYAKALFNLGNALREYGLVKDAVATYQQALAARADWADAHINLGNAFFELHQPEQAIASYRRAAELDATNPDLDASLGNAYLDLAQLDKARACYRREVERHPQRWLRRLRLETLAEPIAPSNAWIDDYRQRLVETLGRFASEARPIEPAELHTAGAEPPMALTYQGRDDRPIKEKYADLYSALIPDPGPPPRNDGKSLVGIVVTHGHEGVFFKCLGGIVNRISTASFRLALVCCRSGENILRQWLRNPGVEYITIPERVDQAAERLRTARFDLLHYWEVGTDSMNYFLPFYRPARLQSATWGWPVTSGNARLDYYVSSRLLEPDDGESHYREKLIHLETLPTCYARPIVPVPLKDRPHFNLKASDHVYLCPQNLRKYHPDFDPLVAGILRADPQGRFVMLADSRKPLTDRLLDRMRTALPDVWDRVLVLPRLPEAEYLNVVALADVVLDTPHYGGGANTVYDALSVGTPLVTLPGPFHRGRWALAAYQQLGLSDGIAASAAEYVTIAARIGMDGEYRRDFKSRIFATSAALFEDMCAVAELEGLFRGLVEPPVR